MHKVGPSPASQQVDTHLVRTQVDVGAQPHIIPRTKHPRWHVQDTPRFECRRAEGQVRDGRELGRADKFYHRAHVAVAEIDIVVQTNVLLDEMKRKVLRREERVERGVFRDDTLEESANA